MKRPQIDSFMRTVLKAVSSSLSKFSEVYYEEMTASFWNPSLYLVADVI